MREGVAKSKLQSMRDALVQSYLQTVVIRDFVRVLHLDLTKIGKARANLSRLGATLRSRAIRSVRPPQQFGRASGVGHRHEIASSIGKPQGGLVDVGCAPEVLTVRADIGNVQRQFIVNGVLNGEIPGDNSIRFKSVALNHSGIEVARSRQCRVSRSHGREVHTDSVPAGEPEVIGGSDVQNWARTRPIDRGRSGI